VRTSHAGTQASRPTIQPCRNAPDPRLSIALIADSIAMFGANTQRFITSSCQTSLIPCVFISND
jgi:hypothetical protein